MTVTDPEVELAAVLSPRAYLLLRLNAALQGRQTLPAHEGWGINTKTQKKAS